MDGKYTFDEFCDNLDNGYQIYYTYVRNRYLLYKTAEKFLLPILGSFFYLVHFDEFSDMGENVLCDYTGFF